MSRLAQIFLLILASLANFAEASSRLADDVNPRPELYSGEIRLEQLNLLFSQGVARFMSPTAKVYDPEEFTYGPAVAHRLHVVFHHLRQMFSLDRIPEPHLMIMGDKNPGAYCPTVQACVPGLTTINGGKTGIDKSYIEATHLYDQPLQIKTGGQGQDFACLDVSRRREWQNLKPTLKKGPCPMREENGKINFDCGKNSSESFQSESLRWNIMVPYVVISVGALSSLRDWDEVDALLAHELGHYVLMHPLRREEISYFFDRTQPQNPFRPLKDSNLARLGQIVTQKTGSRRGLGFENFFHSDLSLRILQSLMIQLLKKLSNEPNSTFASPEKCDQYRTAFGILESFIYFDPGFPDSSPARQNFAKVRDCLLTIGTAAPLEQYLKTYFDPIDWPVISYFNRKPRELPIKNLWEAFQTVDGLVSAGMSKFKFDPDLRRLGFYTVEEEADVFAMNYLKARKMDPATAQKWIISLIDHSAASNKFRKSYRECLAAYRRGWRNLRGPFVPRMDDASEEHHSICYRIYDLERIAKFSNLDFNGTLVDEPESVDYNTVRAYFSKERDHLELGAAER